MSSIAEIPVSNWAGPFGPDLQKKAVTALEDDSVLFFSSLAFKLDDNEKRFLDPKLVDDSKAVSYNPETRRMVHCAASEADKPAVAAMIHRFCDYSQGLIEGLLPQYKGKLTPAGATLRPVEAEGRHQEWRKDDTRLHVDAFPTTPLNGKRILRLFSNVNPHGQPRCWRIGEPFPKIAQTFAPRVKPPSAMGRLWKDLFGKTKTKQSLYDFYMVSMHDAMKADDEYQRTCAHTNFDFPAQTSWLTFTDSVPHAVTRGQHQFVQTFHVDLEAMAQPEKSPLRILEKQLGRNLRN